MTALTSHLLALALLAMEEVARAWRIQLAARAAGTGLAFREAFRLNLYGEAASAVTPNRLGGELARFGGLTWAGVRPVTALVALGVEVAAEWPVFGVMALGLFVYYVPDWASGAGAWIGRHRAADLLAIEIAVPAALGAYLLLRAHGRNAARELLTVGWWWERRDAKTLGHKVRTK